MSGRPVHLRRRFLALVAVGGTAGTALREAVGLLLGAPGWPLAIFAINLSGSLALGVLLEWLSRQGSDEGSRRAIRLALGTGLLGGYTTYGALAVDSVTLLAGGQVVTGLLYPIASVVGGVAAAGAGVALVRRWNSSVGVR
ncbi:MAG: CrcB family protein [Micropruina sp.]|nr:CrcB family protein [Micropruina sp.]